MSTAEVSKPPPRFHVGVSWGGSVGVSWGGGVQFSKSVKSVKLLEINKMYKTTPRRPTTPAEEGAVQNHPSTRFFFRCARPRCKLSCATPGFAKVPGRIFLHPPKLFRRGTKSGSGNCRKSFFPLPTRCIGIGAAGSLKQGNCARCFPNA